MQTIVERLERNVALGRPRTLTWIAAEKADESETPEAFLASVRRFGGLLAGRVPRRAVLPILLEPGSRLWHAFYGAIGAGLIPSIFATPNYKTHWETYARNLCALLARYRTRTLLVEEGIRGQLSDVLASVGADLGPIETLSADAVTAAREAPLLRGEPGEVAFLQHSSGSTGIQKGVALSHRKVLAQVDEYRSALGLEGDEQIVSWLPLYHDMGLISCCLLPCLAGVSIASLAPHEWVARPESLLEAIARYRGTHVWLPNFAFAFMARRIKPESVASLDLRSLRALVNCSEPVLARSLDAFHDSYARLGVRREVLSSSYAMAENVFAVTQTPKGREPARLRARPSSLVLGAAVEEASDGTEVASSGVALPSTEVSVRDPEDGAPLPARTVGEICLEGPCVFSEYHENPEVTRAAFRGARYRTGDLGFLDGAELYVLGRLKDLIIVGGRNFYPNDLETLANDIPGVKEGRVVAFGVLDEEKGTEDVVVLLESDQHADPKAVTRIERAMKAAAVQRVDCVIERVVVLAPGELVKTSSGKIARSDNKRLHLEGRRARGPR